MPLSKDTLRNHLANATAQQAGHLSNAHACEGAIKMLTQLLDEFDKDDVKPDDRFDPYCALCDHNPCLGKCKAKDEQPPAAG